MPIRYAFADTLPKILLWTNRGVCIFITILAGAFLSLSLSLYHWFTDRFGPFFDTRLLGLTIISQPL